MNVLIFGATGSAGGSVLHASLDSPVVERVHVITRRPLKLSHKKLRVFQHGDFEDYGPIAEAFTAMDACSFCLGISVNQVSGEDEYRKITHDFAIAAARALRLQSPKAVFHFISGGGTNEKSRMMWSRVKGATERELISDFGAVCWRPAFIDGENSENGLWLYNTLRPIFRVLKPFRGLYIAGRDLGNAMIQATIEGMRGQILENRDFHPLAARATGSGG
ncbi:MAG: hypothetical protein ABIR47_00025 [Candidatus Kapaibacterium sp.]